MKSRSIDRALLAASYVILIVGISAIGWIVEHNSTQTQERVCAALGTQIRVNVELSLYARALSEGTTVDQLRPTDTGQAVANDIRQQYAEVCDAAVD